MNGHPTYNNADSTSVQHQHGSGGRMGLLMLLCCLGPVAAILAVTVFGVPFSGVITVALFLLCPLMMVFMMSGGHGHVAAESAQTEPSRVQEKTDIAA